GGDGGAKGALTLRKIRRPRPQAVEAPSQSRQQRLWLEDARTGCGDLDGEREAIEAATDLRHGGGVLRGQGEVVTHGAGPIDEELHCRQGGQLLERQGPLPAPHGQGGGRGTAADAN